MFPWPDLQFQGRSAWTHQHKEVRWWSHAARNFFYNYLQTRIDLLKITNRWNIIIHYSSFDPIFKNSNRRGRWENGKLRGWVKPSAWFFVLVSGIHCRVGTAHQNQFIETAIGGQCPPYAKECMQHFSVSYWRAGRRLVMRHQNFLETWPWFQWLNS